MSRRTALRAAALALGITSTVVLAPIVLAQPAQAAVVHAEAQSESEAIVRQSVVGGSLLALGLLGFTAINLRRSA